MKLLKYFPLVKIDEKTHRVTGQATAEMPDSEGEICDYPSAVKAYTAWAKTAFDSTTGAGQDPSYGNIRLQHGIVVGGKVAAPPIFDDVSKSIMLDTEPKDEVYPDLKRGFYRGFSQGGDYEWRQCNECKTAMPSGRKCPNCKKTVLVRYAPIIAEVSYVDNPCLKTATFSLVKADGVVEAVAFVNPADAVLIKMQDSLAAVKAHAEELGSLLKGEVAPQTVEPTERSSSMSAPAAAEPVVEKAAPVLDLDAISKAVTAQVLEALQKAKPAGGDSNVVNKASDPLSVVKEESAAKAAAVTLTKEDLKKNIEDLIKEAQGTLGMAKSMYSIGRLADVIVQLYYLQQDSAMEGKYENNGAGDPRDAAIAGKLGSSIQDLVSTLKDVVNEETSEILDASKAASALQPAAAETSPIGVMQMSDTNDALAKARKSVAEHLSNMTKLIADHNTAVSSATSAHAQKMQECMGKLHKILGAEIVQQMGDNDPDNIDPSNLGTDQPGTDMTRKAAGSEGALAKAAPAAAAATTEEPRFTKAEVEQMVEAGVNSGLQQILKAMTSDDSGEGAPLTKAAPTAGIGKRDDTPVFLQGMGPAVRVMPVTKMQDAGGAVSIPQQQQQAAPVVTFSAEDVHKAAQGDVEAGLRLMKGVKMTTEIPATVAAAISSVR